MKMKLALPAPRQLKPAPATIEDCEQEVRSIPHLNLYLKPPPRVKLCHYIVSSAKIKRSLQSAMILLVGTTGDGKSSTINHLLDTGEAVAKTCDSESETTATSEYVLFVDEPDYEVSGLTLSIIDTPGLNDTLGVNQDACNLASIKKFFETHPKIQKKIYPNLVFLVVSAMDQRIKGPNSKLAKNLRGIKLLDVVDKNHPNLVVVMTFCHSVPHPNTEEWEETMQKKKNMISNFVFQVLGIRAPVVVLENAYGSKGHKLPRDGDYTVLLNGERQPKNLYEACLKLLQRSRDHFGLMVLNSFFRRAEKDKVINGYQVYVKDSRVETLSDQEKQFSTSFSEAAKGDPLAMRATEYIMEKELNNSQQEEIMKLVESMNSLGLSDEAKLKSVTIGEINYAHGGEISDDGIAMLQEKFKIKSEIASLNSAQLFGQGYNIIADRPADAEIMKFATVDDKKFGFKIPGCAQISKVNQTRECEMEFESVESYMASRLANLGLNFELVPKFLAKVAPKFGVNRKNDSCVTSTKTTKSSLIEYRMVKISIGSFKSDRIQFSPDFVSAVKELPDQYTNNDDTQTNSDRSKFEKFFEDFGHFVVTSAFVGGSVEITTRGENLEVSKQDQKSRGGSAGVKTFGADVENQSSTKSAKKATIDIENTVWQGGRSDLHNKSTLDSEEKLKMWKASLAKDPILLKTEMSLQPISKVVAIINEKKEDACYKALCSHLGVDDLKPVYNPQEECASEAKKDMEEDLRKESNIRAGSVKEPDSEGWWKMFTRGLRRFCDGVSGFFYNLFS